MRNSAVIDPASDLLGREPELARIGRLLGEDPGAQHALLLAGARGVGKSRLLAAGVHRAREAGRHRILLVDTAGSLVRQLLLAVRHELPALPASLARPALAFLGLGTGPADSGPEVLCAALSAALTAIGRRSPVLIAADDVHRLDAGAATALAGLAGLSSVALLAAGSAPVPAGLAGLPVLGVRPLGPADSVRLLDAQPGPLTGRHRAEVLRRAAGNPAALFELATAGAPEGSLQAAFAAEIGRLPAPVRRLLLHLAAATGPAEPQAVMSAAAVTTDIAWQPAERAGLITRTRTSVDFTHPLAAAAAYRSAPAHLRQQAHRELAAALTALPERRALHLAAATPGRDEDIAAGLEAAAAVFRDRGELFEATAAMEEAAQRSPSPQCAARRFTQAVTDARDLGETGWAGELYATVRRMTGDPDLVSVAARGAATALSRSGRQSEAYGMLVAARRAGPPTDRTTTLTIAGLAAAIAGISGHDEHRRGLVPMLEAAGPAADETIATLVRQIIDPASHPGRELCDATTPPRPGTALSPPERHRLSVLATIAWHEDRSRLAAGLLRSAVDGRHGPRTFPPGTEALPVLVSALIDTGDWVLADRCAGAAEAVALPLVGANLAALRAQLHALRGDSDQALQLAQQTWQRLDIQENRSTHVRLLRAAGLAAIGGGDYENGYRYLRSMFDLGGLPWHPFIAARSVAELVAAAARSGRGDDARTVLDRVRAGAGAEPSARMRMLLHLSEALLADGDRAEHHFRLATVDPAGHEWPYERALARLHYGEWLRRARRPRDARAVLAAAAATFTELGAGQTAELARRELRASGQAEEPAGASPLTVLTPQERQVALLAARGLRNREIAEQLYISVRTVGAHLYSVYPKLGVSGRHQLRDAFPRD